MEATNKYFITMYISLVNLKGNMKKMKMKKINTQKTTFFRGKNYIGGILNQNQEKIMKFHCLAPYSFPDMTPNVTPPPHFSFTAYRIYGNH